MKALLREYSRAAAELSRDDRSAVTKSLGAIDLMHGFLTWVRETIRGPCVVAKIRTPSCSQHVSIRPFLVNSPETSLMRFLTSRLDRTNDFDVFALLSSHIRKESAEWKPNAPRLTRSVPSNNLLQICSMESSCNLSNYEEENDEFAETKL